MAHRDIVKGCLIVSGSAVLAVGALGLVHLVKKYKTLVRASPYKRIEDNIKLEELAILTRSPNVNLRRSAEQLILDRVLMDIDALRLLLSWCKSDDPDNVHKALMCICVIIKSEDEIQSHPCAHEFLQAMALTLTRTLNPGPAWTQHPDSAGFIQNIQKLATCGILELICDKDLEKEILCNGCPRFILSLLEILENTRHKEVARFSLFILHQIVIQESTRELLPQMDCIRTVARLLLHYHGEGVSLRLLLQILVIFSTSPGKAKDSKTVLQCIGKENVIVPCVASLRSEDGECVYWSVALLHEFAINDLQKESIIAVYGLLPSLSKTLITSEANLQRLVLRLLCFLMLRNDGFKVDVVSQREIVERLPVCFASGDREVVHWAVVLTHDLAILGKITVEKMVGSCEALIPSLLALADQGSPTFKRLLAETLGFFCSCEHLLMKIIDSGLIKTVLMFASGEDAELKFWSSAMLLNMAMTSDDVKYALVKEGALSVLMELAIEGHDNSQISTMAAKTLTMMGFVDKSLPICVECDEDGSKAVILEQVHHFTKPGMHLLIWNPLSSKVGYQQHYSVAQPWELKDLVIDLPSRLQDKGNVVIVVIQGPLAQGYLKALKDHLVVQELVEMKWEVPTGQSVVILAALRGNALLDVQYMKKDTNIKTSFNLPYMDIVNQLVTEIIVVPVIKILFSTPPDSPISKVQELELLEVLGRHADHRETMLNCEGFIEYLDSMITQFERRLAMSQDFPPISIAHCLACLRALSVLSIHDLCCEQLFMKDVYSQIIGLLFFLSGVWIDAVLDTAQAATAADYSQQDNEELSLPALAQISTILEEGEGEEATSGGDNEQTTQGALLEGMVSSTPLVTSSDSGTESVGSSLQFQFPPPGGSVQSESRASGWDVSGIGEELRPRLSVEDENMDSPHSGCSKQEQDKSALLELISAKESNSTQENKELSVSRVREKLVEYDETYCSLARFAILTLCNATLSADSVLKGAACEAAIQSGAFHTIWSVLLCSGAVLKASLALSASACLTRLSCPIEEEDMVPRAVLLNRQDRSPALQLSADQLEVRNDSWSFESIRATHGVSAADFSHSGVYYEVTLKSGGIIQVGWASKDCVFAPEKGLGVGDDINSYSYDGGRCKIWNGKKTEHKNNDYGMEWHEMDTVSVLLHRSGAISFWHKGVDMGTAFKDVDMRQTWFPALSLSTEQQIRINFGSTDFQYAPPKGFLPYAAVYKRDQIIPTSPLKGMSFALRLRDLLLPLGEPELHPEPSIFYEVDINAVLERPLVLGVSTMAGWKGMEAEQVCVVLHDKYFELPNGIKLEFNMPNVTIGCGIVVPPGAVFFTVDGRPLKSMFSFPTKELGQDPLVPFTNNPFLNMNFGQAYFMYEPANKRENRLSMAALLHDYHNIRCTEQGNSSTEQGRK